MLLEYILELHNYGELPFKKLSYVNSEKYMELNFSTQRNLELTAREMSSNAEFAGAV